MYCGGVVDTPAFLRPAFLGAAGHDVRWRLLNALAASDRQVHELVALVGQPQNLVSYHLRQLRQAKLVTARRSSADGRETYYRLDLARCVESLGEVGGALHPALRVVPPPLRPLKRRVRVLFLCTGSHPKPVHPDAVAVMAGYGVDLSRARSKHVDRFTGEEFDYVVTLCDRLREICPEFPGDARIVHWSIPEPDDYAAFERVAAELMERIEFLRYTLEVS